MTIRYDSKHEKKIKLLMDLLGEKTMSKAFLKAPKEIMNQLKTIKSMGKIIDDQRDEIEKLKEIVDLANNSQLASIKKVVSGIIKIINEKETFIFPRSCWNLRFRL